MKKDDSGYYWFHIPILLLKIVRILTKTPSGPLCANISETLYPS